MVDFGIDVLIVTGYSFMISSCGSDQITCRDEWFRLQLIHVWFDDDGELWLWSCVAFMACMFIMGNLCTRFNLAIMNR